MSDLSINIRETAYEQEAGCDKCGVGDRAEGRKRCQECIDEDDQDKEGKQ